MTDISSNKRIAKNTLFLYFRMMFTMVVTLFTSRIILRELGVDDYGIYQVVGGIVGFLSFMNSALATGSSRFLIYALGEDNFDKLKRTFSTTFSIHVLMAILVVIVAETIGLWFLYNKLVIAPERMSAAVYTYHLSIFAAVFTLTQVPYNSIIIAHERIAIYAYMCIIEVVLKLGICFLLFIGGYDKLKLYATLLLGVQIGLMIFYRFYCTRHFKEAKYSFAFDRKIFLEIAHFSGWSMFASSAIALNSQGILVLLNLFFSPAVVAARAISLQVNAAANQFVSNFRQAVTPQIVKKFAAGDYEGSKSLLLESTKYSYYLMFMIGLPICILASPILNFWLGVVPDYTVPFLQIIIVQSLFQVFDTSFYTALYAKGQLRENALTSPVLGFLIFPFCYIFFKLGFSPLALSWMSLAVYAILGCIFKPFMIIKLVNYTWKDIWSVFRPCLIVTLASLPLPICLSMLLDGTLIGHFIIIGFTTVITIGVVIFFFGLNRLTKKKIFIFIKTKITHI